jgi:hypothetical protein
MPKMSFAQRIDVWKALTGNPPETADDVPGLAALRAELTAITEEVLKTRGTYRRLRTRALLEGKRLEQAIARGEEAEQRFRRLLQATYGTKNPQLHRFGLKPHRRRRLERTGDEAGPADETEEPAGVGGEE